MDSDVGVGEGGSMPALNGEGPVLKRKELSREGRNLPSFILPPFHMRNGLRNMVSQVVDYWRAGQSALGGPCAVAGSG